MTRQVRRVLIFGDFRPDRLGSSFRRAFEILDCHVIRADTVTLGTELAPWLRSRLGHRATAGSLPMRRMGSRSMNQSLLALAARSKADLAVILNGDFVMPETLASIRSLGTNVFVFHADNPFPPYAPSRPEHLPSAREADCYFIWSRALALRLGRAGVRHVEYLPFAWDAAVFPFQSDRAKPVHDVVFIGGWDRTRERLLADVARHFPLKIWGPSYWITRTRPWSPLRGCWQGGAATGGDAARIIAQSRVVLNVLRDQNLPDGTNMRTFEVPGCGNITLATRSAGATDIFPEGRSSCYFDSTHSCLERVEWMLSHDAERRDMADEAHVTVKRCNTYVHRAQRILDIYENHAELYQPPIPSSNVAGEP